MATTKSKKDGVYLGYSKKQKTMATLSVKNVNRRSPLSFVRVKRVVNMALIPVVVLTLKGLWEGSEVSLNKILLIITVTLPGVLEAVGLLLADNPMEINTDNVTGVKP